MIDPKKQKFWDHKDPYKIYRANSRWLSADKRKKKTTMLISSPFGITPNAWLAILCRSWFKYSFFFLSWFCIKLLIKVLLSRNFSKKTRQMRSYFFFFQRYDYKLKTFIKIEVNYIMCPVWLYINHFSPAQFTTFFNNSYTDKFLCNIISIKSLFVD